MNLTGARLVLREFETTDLAAVHAFGSDPLVVRYTDWGPNTVADTETFLRDSSAAAVADPQIRYPFAVTHAGELVGSASLRVVSTAHRRGEIGYLVGPGWWGGGYATEAAGLLLRFGFDHLGLHKIAATCHPDNAGSVRVLMKIGMGREGLLRNHVLVRGAWQDRLLFGALG